jgi:hypothetical protein
MNWEEQVALYFENKERVQEKNLSYGKLLESVADLKPDATEPQVTKQSNMRAAIEQLSSMGVNFSVNANKIKVLGPHAERPELMVRIRKVFEPVGYEFDPNRGGSMGTLKLLDRENGSVYIFVKPDSSVGQAATTGAEYEEHIANLINHKYGHLEVEASSAGFGHGSDLTVQTVNDALTFELKTSSGADFGQFKLGFNPAGSGWFIVPTKGFEKNKELFSGLFNDFIKDYLNGNARFADLNDPRLNIRSGAIVGLKPHDKTGELRDELNNAWYKGRKDLIVPVDFSTVAGYYASKGDEFIQIAGKGLYAFRKENAERYGVPLFQERGQEASVRFRIKPHMGHTGTHSFTVAIKLKIQKSDKDLLNDEDLDGIISDLL